MLYYNPDSFDEALKLIDSLKDEKNIILAGGTDVVPKINSRPERSGYFDKPLAVLDQNIIYLGGSKLDYIKDSGNEIAVGAMTTMTQLLESPVMDKVPVIKDALNLLAGITVRNSATIGGNVMNASPAADSVPGLIVLGAKAVVASVNGERTLDVADLFVGPGKTVLAANEILKEIVIPVKTGKASFLKFGRRKAESLSVVNGAAYVEMDGAVCKDVVIALGAVAPTPIKLDGVAEGMIGKEITNEVIEAAAAMAVKAVKPIDDKRASGEYRKKLVKVLVQRTLTSVCS